MALKPLIATTTNLAQQLSVNTAQRTTAFCKASKEAFEYVISPPLHQVGAGYLLLTARLETHQWLLQSLHALCL